MNRRQLLALPLLLALLPLGVVGAAPKARGPQPIRLLALGDSFTIGTSLSPEESFPARLAARWRESGREVVLSNLAVNGFTTDDLLTEELPRVKGFAPTWVTLAVGANDLVRRRSPATYKAKLDQIFEALVLAGVPMDHVLVLPQPEWSLSPTGRSFGEPAALSARIADFDRTLAEVTLARGARWMALKPLMLEQARLGQWARDGLHPDATAHDAWAAKLAELVKP